MFHVFLGISVNAESPTVGQCVTSCKDVPSGDYQSCKGCEFYVSCIYGRLIGPRRCPIGTEFDDQLKVCVREGKSSTCKMSTGEDCITSCSGLESGFYQSCDSCSTFLQCYRGHMFSLACPASLKWDNKEKLCEEFSSTCTDKPVTTTTMSAPSTATTPTTTTPIATSSFAQTTPVSAGNCIKDCAGISDGYYQSC